MVKTELTLKTIKRIHAMKTSRFVKSLVIMAVVVLIVVAGTWAIEAPTEGSGNTLLIFQIGASQAGSNSANVSHSFVELYNAGEEPVNLTGYSLQYAAGTRGTVANEESEDGPWQKINLVGIIEPGHSFLILGDRLSTMANPALNIVDNSGDMNVPDFELSNRSVKVALMSNTDLLTVQNPFNIDGSGTKAVGYVDMIGVVNDGTSANPDKIRGLEGTVYFNGDLYRISQQTGVRRKSLMDTDNNSFDFEAISYRDVSTEVTEAKRPRNHSNGKWNPVPEGEGEKPPAIDQVSAGTRDELAGKLLIFQAYGSSNNAAGVSHSFVELYNTTDAAIDLIGITLYYADGTNSATATEDKPWKKLSLRGTIHARSSFLILGPRENSTGRLQITDNSGDINEPAFMLSNRAFKAALIRSTKDLTVQNPFTMDGAGIAEGYIDMVGSANTYITADLIFGFETYPARNSASAVVRRKTLIDTDDNSIDFASIDYRLWSASNPDRTTDEELEIYRPKNCNFGPWDAITGDQYEPGDPDGPVSAITSFKFSYQDIGWQGDQYWEGDIDHDAKTIIFTTQQWIENIEKLSAIFELDDDGVAKVSGKSQWSGITQNDFRRDVIYTVGDNRYTVSFVSPQATGLPVIRIDTENAAEILDKETWVTMTFALSDPNNPGNNIAAINNQQIRGRGNNTWNAPKKPYRIRFRDNQQQSPFGLPPARNWVLLANYWDLQLLRTPFGFEFGKRLGLQYTPSYNHVELYLNNIYQGNYLFTEHRQADPTEQGAPGRVKIDLNEGWLVEIDRYWDEEPKFWLSSLGNLPIMIKSPEFEPIDINNPAYDFVRDDWTNLIEKMVSENFPENGYRDLIDIESFIKYFLVQVVIYNNDFAAPGNAFFYKEDKNGKISAGPLWDLDGGFWREWDKAVYPPHLFFDRFFHDPVFLARWKEIWNDNYDNIYSMSEFIDDMAGKIRKSAEENYKIWWLTLPDTGLPVDYDSAIEEMKQWLEMRISYLDQVYNNVDVLPANRSFETTTYNYSEVSAQTFTLVAYDEMTDLTSVLKSGAGSAFEITTGISSEPTGNGGYLATISVRPKNSLSAGTHTDTLVLSGINQGVPFLIEVPLTFAVNKGTREFVASQAIETDYLLALTLGKLELPAGYRWGVDVNTSAVLIPGYGQSFTVIYFDPNGNWNDVAGTIVINVADPENIFVRGIHPEFQIGLAKDESNWIYEPEYLQGAEEVEFMVSGGESQLTLWLGKEDVYPALLLDGIESNKPKVYDVSEHFYEIEVPEGVSGVGISFFEDVWYIQNFSADDVIPLLKTDAQALLVYEHEGVYYERTFIPDGSDPFADLEQDVVPVRVVPAASVEKHAGSQNNMTVSFTETLPDGSTRMGTMAFTINENTAGYYRVGPYLIYVDATGGGSQIRRCYIVNQDK